MKNHNLVLTAAIVALLSSTPLMAIEKGDILLNARLLNVAPDVGSNDIKGLDGSSAGLGGIDVDDAYSLGLDITYMVTNNFGVELMLDTTSSHDIKGASGLPVKNVGDVTVLPPSLIAVWYFKPGSNVRPYVGAGVNYTFFFSEDTTNELDSGLGGDTSLDVDDAFGLVAQVGVDIDINKDWYVSFDAKYIDMDTEATIKVNGDKAATVDFDVNPLVLGIGVGTKF